MPELYLICRQAVSAVPTYALLHIAVDDQMHFKHAVLALFHVDILFYLSTEEVLDINIGS